MSCGCKFFQAVGHPTRERILELLRKNKELSVNELVKKLGYSQSTVSHHLSIMKKAKVVLTRDEGTSTFYSICQCTIEDCCKDMQKYLK
jgi:DNA-binding transcriptional ArsR family regulator